MTVIYIWPYIILLIALYAYAFIIDYNINYSILCDMSLEPFVVN